jgi:serine/threonine-protein kinase RsbT
MSRKPIRMKIATDADVTTSLLNARVLAGVVGFDGVTQQRIATAVSELARNILKYAGSGEVILAEALCRRQRGIEVTVRDRGPGIEDIEQALQDQYSSSGTLGLGLPGVKRMMDEFEINTEVGRGTTVVIRQWL